MVRPEVAGPTTSSATKQSKSGLRKNRSGLRENMDCFAALAKTRGLTRRRGARR